MDCFLRKRLGRYTKNARAPCSDERLQESQVSVLPSSLLEAYSTSLGFMTDI